MRINLNKKGFTLIELLIVIAIIAILAAIAIPQFAAYRMRGYNAAANTDTVNGATAEEALMSDWGGYGSSFMGVVLPGPGWAAVGVEIPGPIASASGVIPGAGITMGPTAGGAGGVPPPRPITGVGTGVSNQVYFQANALNAAGVMAGYGTSYILASKHLSGNRAYGKEAPSTATFVCQNGGVAWVNVPTLAMIAGWPLAANTTSVYAPLGVGAACGGLEITNWTAL